MTLNNLIDTIEHMDKYYDSLVTVTSCSTEYIANEITYNDFKNGQLFKVLGDVDIIQWKVDNNNDTRLITIQLDIPTIDEETVFYVGVGVKKEGEEDKKAVITLNAEELTTLNKLLLNDKDCIQSNIASNNLKAKTTLEIYIDPSLDAESVLGSAGGNIEEIFGNGVK